MQTHLCLQRNENSTSHSKHELLSADACDDATHECRRMKRTRTKTKTRDLPCYEYQLIHCTEYGQLLSGVLDERVKREWSIHAKKAM